MREIKYRAWFEAEMLTNEALERKDQETTAMFTVLTDNPHGDEVVFMQYTGLKDYAGKEIYEGDIVEEVVSNNPRIFEVKWDEYGMFLFVPRSLNDSTNAIDYYELQDEVGEIIVIGNIYEHPHLLEGDSIENQ